MARNYFRKLFSIEAPSCLAELPCGLFPEWTENEQSKLLKPITEKEVNQALFSMGPLKAPGSDGFQAIFFQKSWSTVKTSLVNCIKRAFELGELPPKLNETLLVLIPKIKSPETITQFRPISLCNVTYKILTKIIVSRLKTKLPELISKTQGSFVLGRQVIDNIVIFQEALHTIKSKQGRKGWMAIKIDLEKAYDKLQWEFIEDTLRDMGIPDHLTKMIMNCVSGTTMKIIWNGEETEEFRPARGLRQGDPLSPYLFVSCMERLAQWITLATRRQEWKPLCITRGGPTLSHLFFADDIILFGEATTCQAKLIKHGLDVFCRASGQRVSEAKSRIFFSKNVSKETRIHICSELGMKSTLDLGRYLGIPALHTRVTKQTFHYITERVQSKLAGWKMKQLSMAGRVTLAKSVLSSLPIYAMQVISLPKGLCDKLDKITRNFIWGDSEDGRKPHLVKWEEVCKPKDQGGLGLKSARQTNEILLAKLGWRFLMQPEECWSQVLYMKYNQKAQPGTIFVKKARQSAIWSGLNKTANFLLGGLMCSVGDGTMIKFWKDDWVPGLGPLISLDFIIPADHLEKTVSEYWESTKGWRWDLITSIIPAEWLPNIADVFVDEEARTKDSFAWRHSNSREFTTSSAHQAFPSQDHNPANPGRLCQVNWKHIWQLQVPKRVRFFMWSCLKGKIMTNQERFRRKITPNPYCPRCRNKPESIIHLLRDCPKVHHVWRRLVPTEAHRLFFTADSDTWIQDNLKISASVVACLNRNTLFSTACWWLWKWRNNEVFDRDHAQPEPIAFICKQTKEYGLARQKKNNLQPKPCQSVRQNTNWTKPQQGWLKLNTDGCAKKNPRRAGCGGAIRDAEGSWIVGFSQEIGSCSALVAELRAIRSGLYIAKERNLTQLIVESDSMLAVNYLTEGVARSNFLFTLVNNCRHMIQLLDRVEVTHCNRECNKLADSLANYALAAHEEVHIHEHPPDFCIPFLREDLAL